MIARIKELCKQHHTNFSRLEHDLGFANGSVAKSDGKIQAERLQKIADYFDVTMEYLLTGKDSESISDWEKELINIYRQLKDKQELRDYAHYLLSREKRDVTDSKIG
jgi:transcriptional regulator with XRE-family HTH domain